MEPWIYLAGEFVPTSRAKVSVLDRGFLFGDGVYEVVRFYQGRAFALDEHLRRLRDSLAAIHLPAAGAVEDIPRVSHQIVARNECPNCTVYWQVTRGVAPRDPSFPAAARPTVFAMTNPLPAWGPDDSLPEVAAWVVDDLRWHRCDIKSLALLPNVLAKHEAERRGASVAVFRRGNLVTESTSANVMVVLDGVLRTHPTGTQILPGVTRGIVLQLAREMGMTVEEVAVTVEELGRAEEVMACGTTTHVTAITRLDDRPVGSGAPGPTTRALHDALAREVAQRCELDT